MQYYFDESGNWYGNERHRLVLGGLHMRDEHTVNRLHTEFKLLKSEHNLQFLHANQMSNAALEDCYLIINQALSVSGKSLVHIIDPLVLRLHTKRTPDEIYIDLAADLVSTLVLGDDNPCVNYDMKFHYAYPENIVSGINKLKPYHYHRLIEALELTDKAFPREKERIIQKLSKQKSSGNVSVDKFMEELCTNGKTATANYLWSELILQIQGKENMRESFRNAIIGNLKRLNGFSPTQRSQDNLQLSFFAKDQENAGVEIIDILCNLVYRYGINAPATASNAVKGIYNQMIVEKI